MDKIYLDAQATTPLLPEAKEAMLPFLGEHFGNANSDHQFGWKAKMAVNKGLEQIAELVGCEKDQVFITSGATESLHWAIVGWARKNPGGQILTTTTEHKATYGACEWAQELGVESIKISVTPTGQIKMDELESHLGKKPTLITLIHGNNEIGTLNPIKAVADLAQGFPQTFVHVDAAQSVGKVPISFRELNLDYLSFSGHKLYGPKGIGALIIKDKASLAPLFLGGGQQQGQRAGTLNVAGIVGLGVACEWCLQHMTKETQRLIELRDQMIGELVKSGKVSLNGDPQERLPNNLSLTFQNLSMDKLLLALPGVAFSASSACSSGQGEPSHVLQAIGLSPDDIRSTVRFGLSFGTSQEELQRITAKILEIL